MYSNKESSPVKATIASSLKEGLEFFYYKKSDCKNKTVGLSPNGKTKIPLKKHEGESHNRVRHHSNPSMIISGDSPIKAPYKDSQLGHVLQLVLKLKNLKNRVDADYSHVSRGENDDKHIAFTQDEIDSCIMKLQSCYQMCSKKEMLVEELNAYIQKQEIYNPFSLKKIYKSDGYDFKAASGSFNQELDKENFLTDGQSRRKLDIEEDAPSKAKKRELPGKNTMFQPRVVKMKREHKETSEPIAWQNK